MEYNKPKSMSHKEYLVRALSVKLAMSEKIVEAVVNHQFQSANEAMDVNRSLELSGFGRILFNNKKAIKKLAALEAKLERTQKQLNDNNADPKKLQDAIEVLQKQIRLLKPKIKPIDD
jgi:peptidoglycan hydrolase CwlO-like protein